jgi:hypothetical protein
VGRHQGELQESTVKHEVAVPPADDDTGPTYAAYAQIVKVLLRFTTTATRPMSVAVLNHLPTINMILGTGQSVGHQAVRMNVLFDTCASLITGYKSYHDYFKRKQPEVVHDYEEFDSANTFDPIKLSGALHDPGNISNEIVSTNDTMIRYKTPFWNNEGMPVLLCFSLGNTVSCNTIMVLPTIKGIEMFWNMKKGEVVAEGLKAPMNRFIVTTREAEYAPPKPDRELHSNHVPASPATSRRPAAQVHCLVRNFHNSFGGAYGTLTAPNTSAEEDDTL